jgi:phenylacetate-CoA ligase
MRAFQLRPLPGHDWPPLADATLAQIWVAYLTLDRTQWLRPAGIQQGQLEQIRALLAHCVTNVPYYRNVLPAAGIIPGAIRSLDDFRRIPLLPRRTYADQFAAFAAERLPAGTIATTMQQSTRNADMPTMVLQTNVVHLWWCACYLRDLEWSEIDPSGSLAAIRHTGQQGKTLTQLLQGISQPCWRRELQPLMATGPAHVMDVRQEPRLQMQWLRRIAPDYLLSYPANLDALARLAQADGPLPSLKAIQAISESLTADVRARVEAAFGVPVKYSYNSTEAGYLASPCPGNHGLHVHAENVLVEVLNEMGQPCRPGETGRVYLTHLHNFRGPLVRFELGDSATLGAELCPCGRGLPLLTSPMMTVRDK